MIKRPLNRRFWRAVVEGIKITTIRDRPWPIGESIMTYDWAGMPYRSKHEDFAEVVVTDVRPIRIKHFGDGFIFYDYEHYSHCRFLWDHEGFESRKAMDNWFKRLVPPGTVAEKFMMTFEPRWSPIEEDDKCCCDFDHGHIRHGDGSRTCKLCGFAKVLGSENAEVKCGDPKHQI